MPGRGEALDDVVGHAPRHRADEALGRRRRVRRADPEDLRDERRVAGDPVPHDDAPAAPGHPHHLLGDVERPGREHRAEDARRRGRSGRRPARSARLASPCSKRRLSRPSAAARALPASTRFLAMSTPSTSAPRRAAGIAVVPSPQPRSSTSSRCVTPIRSTSASPLSRMLCRDAGEVALLPQCLVRVHGGFLRPEL